MNRKHAKALSVLLTACMIVGLMPWAALPARAKTAAGTFAELQALLDAAESDGTVKLDRDYAYGGGTDSKTLAIAAGKTVTLDLNGHVVDGSKASNAYAISVSGDLTLTDSSPAAAHAEALTYRTPGGETVAVTGGAVVGNQNSWDCVGVLAEGAFTMNGGTIAGSSRNGVKVNGGAFLMKSGSSITGSSAAGVNVSGGTFVMDGGSITDNAGSNYGGGVNIYGGTFTMNGGTISGNAAGLYGGGVSVANANNNGVVSPGTFAMNGGAISGNTAESGGGVCVNGGTFTMNDGMIAGNTAGNGGGVYVTGETGTFEMKGGAISGGTVRYYGGGVEVSSGTFKVSGGAVITGNVKGGAIEDGVLSGGTANNVYLWESRKITVAGTLTGSIGVTMRKPGVFTSELANGGANAIGRFTSDSGDYAVLPTEDGEAELCVPPVAGAWENGSLTATVRVEEPANALLIAAAYDGAGRQVGVRVIELVDGETTYETGLTKTSGGTCKLMLVDKTTFAPLCEAWSNG